MGAVICAQHNPNFIVELLLNLAFNDHVPIRTFY